MKTNIRPAQIVFEPSRIVAQCSADMMIAYGKWRYSRGISGQSRSVAEIKIFGINIVFFINFADNTEQVAMKKLVPP
jgi:hypothetical protein